MSDSEYAPISELHLITRDYGTVSTDFQDGYDSLYMCLVHKATVTRVRVHIHNIVMSYLVTI